MTTATTRRDSSFKQYQKRVPAEVLRRALGRVYPITLPAVGSNAQVEVTITIRPVIKISLQVREPSEAKRRAAALTEQLNQIFDSVRSGPLELDHRTAVALSGEIYRRVRDHWESNPGPAEDWEPWKAYTWAAIEGRIANPPPASWQELMNDRHAAMGDFGITTGPGLLDAIEQLPPGDNTRSLEVRFGLMASWVLGKHGLEVTERSRRKLLQQVAEAALDAGWAMKRAAQGDYTPDVRGLRFPPIDLSEHGAGVSLTSLFERWQKETKPAPSTVATWKPVLRSLREKVGHDRADRISQRDLVSWKDSLLIAGKSSKTINDSYLACIRALLSFGVQNHLLPSNAGIGVGVKRKADAGTSPLPYEDEEVARLLRISAGQEIAARRWIPLLAACTGARAGELAQLWAERVRTIDGVLALELRPAEDGGTFKNAGSERVIPMHSALVQAGFLDFVNAKKRGPLFYGHVSGKGDRHASKGTVNHLASWIRKQPGFDNPRKAPSHALRHWWKSTASRVGVSDSRADAIQGHTTPGQGARYRHFDLRALANDIERIPIPGQLESNVLRGGQTSLP